MRIVSIILPTYNEAANIPHVLAATSQALGNLDYEILVVDDNSPDRTWKVAMDYAEQNSERIRVIRRLHGRGLSSAVLDGFAAATGHTLVVMDADMQHDESLIPEFVRAIQEDGADFCIGTRHADGGSEGDWSRRRKIVSAVAATMARLFLRIRISDPMSGFFAVKREQFEKLGPEIDPRGFKILLEFLARSPHAKVHELGYTFRNRKHGESKLSPRVAVQYLQALYSLSIGKLIPVDFVQYALVGLSGVFVNQGVTFIAKDGLGLEPGTALAAGIEVSLLSNFILNHFWTFGDVRKPGLRATLKALVLFHIICAAGATINFAVAYTLNTTGELNLYLANLIGIVLATVWNYLINRQITWSPR